MRNVYLVLTVWAAWVALVPTLTAQRMGNRNAPRAGAFIEFRGGNRIEVSYASISFAKGVFMKKVENLRTQEDKDEVEGWIERFNVTAQQQPLGKLKVTGNISLGRKKIAPGDYGLAFMLDEKVNWKVVILDEDQQTKGSWTLDTKAPKATARRLNMWLAASDQGGASLGIAFGDVASKLSVVAGPRERPTSRRARGASGRRRR